MGSSSISNSKRRFALKLGIFIMLLFLLDGGIGAVLKTFYFRQTSGLSFRLTYTMEHSTDDILVLGSSRAQAHYIPSIIEEAVGLSCYNAGRDGQSLLFAYAAQQAVMKRHQPEVIILDLIPRDFFKLDIHYDRLSALLPYYSSHEEIRPIVQLRSKYERLKLTSRIYPYNSLPLQIAKYNLIEAEELDGYVPVYGEMKAELQTDNDENAPWRAGGFDTNMVRAFESLIASCADSGTRLIVVISPAYQGRVPGMAAIDKVMDILEENHVQLWDYSAHPTFANKASLFHDKSHMNDTGARMFSEMIAERLKDTLAPGS